MQTTNHFNRELAAAVAEAEIDCTKAIQATLLAIKQLNILREQYGLDYSDDCSALALLQQALHQQIGDRDNLITFIETMYS